MKAPFVWFGGKSRSAQLIWRRIGNINSYVEPFAGSLGVLLNRPEPRVGPETVNDMDGLLCNFWRAVRSDPEAVAEHADRPVNECELHAVHSFLVGLKDTLAPRLEGDMDWCDAKIAGLWVWGIACWIGSGWCSGKGPWQVIEADDGSRKLVHLGDAGQGVNRQLVHLGSAGRGVNRQRVHLNHTGQGVTLRNDLVAYMGALSDRLRRVRVCCGDWTRVMGETPMFPTGRDNPSYRVGVVLDPPYGAAANRDPDLYRVDSMDVAPAVRAWAIEHGDDPRYRIVLCGYEGEVEMPSTWACIAGKAGHGYGGQSKNGYGNRGRERLFFSPGCINPDITNYPLFAGLEVAP